MIERHTLISLRPHTNSAEYPYVDCRHKIAVIKISLGTLDMLLANNGVYGMS